MKRPYFAFYPKDWQSDPALRACSLEAKGLWMEMLCLMHEGAPYGSLTLPNGHEINTKMLARMIPNCDQNGTRWIRKCTALVDELVTKGVLRRDENGVFYSKKMVSDEADRQNWREKQVKHRSKDVTQKSPPITNTITNTTTLKENPPTPQGGGGEVLKKEKPKPKESHLALAALMAEKVKEAVPLAKIPENLDFWADTIRLIVEVDKIPLPDVESVFLWANKDTFWYKNILCPNTLRRQMGRLDAKKTEEAAKLKATAKDTKPYAIKLLDHPRVRNRWTGQVYRTDDVLVDPTCKIFGNKGSLTVKATGEQMSAEDWEGVA